MAERIDRGLDHHVGDGEQRTLYARRKPDHYYLAECIPAETHLFREETTCILPAHKIPYDKPRSQYLGNGSSQPDSFHSHPAKRHKHQIEQHIEHSCHRKIYQRGGRVPDSPEYGSAEIEDHHKCHSGEIHPHIRGGLVDDIVRGRHHQQKRLREDYSGYSQPQSAYDGCRYCSMHYTRDLVVISGSDTLRHPDSGAYGEADEQVDYEVDQSSGSSDRRQGYAPAEPAGDYQVYSHEEQLEQSGHNDGDSVHYDHPP